MFPYNTLVARVRKSFTLIKNLDTADCMLKSGNSIDRTGDTNCADDGFLNLLSRFCRLMH